MLSFLGEMTIFFICIQRFMNIINIRSILMMIYIYIKKNNNAYSVFDVFNLW